MARSFNSGVNDAVKTVGNTASQAAVTLSVWVRPASFVNAYNSTANRVTAASGFWGIYTKSTAKIAYFVKGTGVVAVDPGSATISANVWTHLAMTYDSVNGLKTYFNGASDGTAAANGAIGSMTSQAVWMGLDSQTAGRAFVGRLADVGVWNTSLTAAEIVALARGARPGTIRSANLTNWWPLDGLQSPEPDLSGNKDNGTLTNTTFADGPPLAPFTRRGQRNIDPAAAAPTFLPAWARGSNLPILGTGHV